MLKYKLTYQFLLVSLCAIIGLQAQEKGFVEISGFLLHNEKRINECFIKYSTHSSTDSVRDIKDGKFKFRLELNREYLIEFGAHKFESKFIAFSTIVEKEKELDRWSKLLIVNLEKEEEFSTWNSEKKPVAKTFPSPSASTSKPRAKSLAPPLPCFTHWKNPWLVIFAIYVLMMAGLVSSNSSNSAVPLKNPVRK